MTNKLLKEIEPSPRIALNIINRVKKYEKRRYQIRLVFHSILTVGAGIAFIPTINYLWQGIVQSGFSSYISLIITDSSTINHLGNLFLSIATSWPVTGSIIVLSIAIIFINSIRRIIQYSSDSSSLSIKYV